MRSRLSLNSAAAAKSVVISPPRRLNLVAQRLYPRGHQPAAAATSLHFCRKAPGLARARARSMFWQQRKCIC